MIEDEYGQWKSATSNFMYCNVIHLQFISILYFIIYIIYSIYIIIYYILDIYIYI